jgi:hypothetical protein
MIEMRIDTDEELISELTNVVMDMIRKHFNISFDSVFDDELYGEIYEALLSTYKEALKS